MTARGLRGGGARSLWKVLGVAGIAGVAATGVAVARAERRRRSYEPEDVRARLHERHHEALAAGAAGPEAATIVPIDRGSATIKATQRKTRADRLRDRTQAPPPPLTGDDEHGWFGRGLARLRLRRSRR